MPPLPYPHRVSFLAPAMLAPDAVAHLGHLYAKVLAALVFDHLIRHPIVTVSDYDDERLTDAADRLLDARHPEIEDVIETAFRVGRRDEVLWLDLSLDATRPQPVRLRSRRPTGPIEEWVAPDGDLAAQITHVLTAWLDARRLPRAGALAPFTLADLHAVAAQLDRAITAGRGPDGAPAAIPPTLLYTPPRLGVAFWRVMGDLSSLDGAAVDQQILRLDPGHPVARRNAFLHALRVDKDADRRAILPVVADAPMYGKPHLSVWGDAFDHDRPDENMGLRHQGIAASLLPANPYACHNYSLQLNDEHRREESYRWADRATIASPGFNNAHLDCVRRLRQAGRPGQAFAEASFRCNDILTRWNQGKISPFEWPARYHAGMLLAFAHFDVGRLDEAIAIAERTLTELGDPEAGHESFGWAVKRLVQWKTDPVVLANAYAWEGHHRGDPGRVLAGFARGRIDDADDAVMQLDALITLGREDLGLLAFHQLQGAGVVGDGKARLAGAKLHILRGELDEALEQLLIVELRRSQSRLEAELNRVLRLAAVRKPDEWAAAIERLIERGARRLARMAARDLADFVPGLDPGVCARAFGSRDPWTLDPAWLAELRAALPALGASGDAIDARLADPHDHALAAADTLAQEWWAVLAAPNRDRDAHAAGAAYALGTALARYLELASGPPTPLAGAYRHVATEALHFLRRARYQIEQPAARGLLALLERCAGAGAPEWLLDPWLLRVERALDLDNEYGAHLPELTAGLPRIGALLRGDERVGWELRLAWDLREDPHLAEPARMMFERCQRALETGAAATEWSNVAAASLPPAEAIDVHWLAALANPGNRAEPWVNLARAQLALGRRDDAFEALCRAFPSTSSDWRGKTIAGFADAWKRAAIDVPFGFDEAQAAGLAALDAGDLARAVRCMRWCEAIDPKNPIIKKNLGIMYARQGDVARAIRAFAGHDKLDAPKNAGAALLEAKHYAEAMQAYRLASLRFGGPGAAEDWRLLAVAAWYAEDDEVAAMAYEKMLAAGGAADAATLHAYASALYGSGQWAACEPIARRLIAAAGGDPTYRSCGLHALAKALCGLGRHAEAIGPAEEAVRLNPLPENAAELAATQACARSGGTPAHKPGTERTIERQAWDALAAGDAAAPERLAQTGNSWGLFRAALAATELRSDAESAQTVPGRALEGARMVLDRTVGNPLPDAVLARIRALRIRENGFIQIDAPPPMGQRLTPAAFETEHARRVAAAAAAAVPAPVAADDPDPIVFPGAPVARLSQYVALVKGLQAGDMVGALGRAGLDMNAYLDATTRWDQRLANDAALSARFTALMRG